MRVTPHTARTSSRWPGGWYDQSGRLAVSARDPGNNAPDSSHDSTGSTGGGYSPAGLATRTYAAASCGASSEGGTDGLHAVRSLPVPCRSSRRLMVPDPRHDPSVSSALDDQRASRTGDTRRDRRGPRTGNDDTAAPGSGDLMQTAYLIAFVLAAIAALIAFSERSWVPALTAAALAAWFIPLAFELT